MKTFLELFDEIVKSHPQKVAFSGLDGEISFGELASKAKESASSIIELGLFKKPIVLYFEKNVRLVEEMVAASYSGNWYVCIDTSMPNDRVMSIFETLNPELIIADDKLIDNIEYNNVKKVKYSDLHNQIKIDELNKVYNKIVDSDICYAIYTSGSTGRPKGTVVNHITLLRYIEWYSTEMDINLDTIFGGQTPFYFSASVSDFYSTLVKGATYYIIPKSYFMFPIKIIELLNEKKINTLYWVPSALAVLSNLDVFKYAMPKYLKKIMFIGEVMHIKHLNYLRRYLPDCEYTNLFGPTETVDVCTYYKVDREFALDESLPIGRHCDNCDTFILKDDNTLAKPGEIGELCVRGSFLAQGYYNMPDKTNEAFCQNPLNTSYPERIYRTGDLVMENERGEYMYLTRKDFQIKHMGYRIELGEIETAIVSMDNIRSCVCVYDKDKDLIVLIYEGKAKENDIYDRCSQKLPKYMQPQVIKKISQMQLNANGKIDINYYKNNYNNL